MGDECTVDRWIKTRDGWCWILSAAHATRPPALCDKSAKQVISERKTRQNICERCKDVVRQTASNQTNRKPSATLIARTEVGIDDEDIQPATRK